MSFLNAVLWSGVALCALPTAVFCLQILSARLGRQGPLGGAARPDEADRLPATVILMPAHNEEKVIAQTLASLDGLPDGFRVVVVADNCNDQTAAIARQWGGSVVERSSQSLRGKGYALQHGLDHLKTQPPEVVIVLDADCTTTADDMHRLAQCCRQLARPVQGIYLMHAPQGSSLATRVAEFAWRVKTMVRPLGWRKWGGTVQLMGSGFALPWSVATDLNLASGHIVEDMKLTFDLAERGMAPVFVTDVRVSSLFPTAGAAQDTQRRRWEHGHLSMVFSDVPRAMVQALTRGNRQLLSVALDLLVPPLSLLVLMLTALAALAVLQMGVSAPSWGGTLALLMAVATAVSVLLAWSGWGRDVLSARELLAVPGFVLRKLGVYAGFVNKREKSWNRTDRD
ncbi:MAG TPA: glycosyltransferase family 2 protein [Burkholderiaceae bacterium]|nr:glycosyltransferase family 2 protein [Burkholderiaceae bacterium]